MSETYYDRFKRIDPWAELADAIIEREIQEEQALRDSKRLAILNRFHKYEMIASGISLLTILGGVLSGQPATAIVGGVTGTFSLLIWTDTEGQILDILQRQTS